MGSTLANYLLRGLVLDKPLSIDEETQVSTIAERACSVHLHEEAHLSRVEHLHRRCEAGLVFEQERDGLSLSGRRCRVRVEERVGHRDAARL